MSGGSRQRHPLLGYLAVEVFAVAFAVVLSVWAPLSAVDRRWFEFALDRAASPEPPRQVVIVEVSLERAKSSDCGRALSRALILGGARAGLLVEPLAELCDGVLDASSPESELAPPIQALPSEIFDTSPSGRLRGLSPAVERYPLLQALGFRPAEWVRTRVPESVPSLDLGELSSGEAKSELLAERIVVVALAGSAGAAGLDPRSAAAVLAGALEGTPAKPLSRSLVGLVVLSISLAAAAIQRRWGASNQRRRAVIVAACLAAALGLPDLAGLAWLLPLPSVLMGFASGYVLLLLPRQVAVAKADKDAQRVLENAGRLLSVQAPGSQDEGEFWRRLARTAAQAHPADDVLIAELPAFSWRLKVWPNGESDESLIKERRRDIRRTPYSNLQGVPVASVVHDYLVMKGAPAVLVPMIAGNDVEGYLMMIGKPAADEFLARPERAQRLASELALLVREGRVTREKNEAWRNPGGMRHVPLDGDLGVLERARATTAELRLLRALLQNAPVGLFYVDSFGDVRVLSRSVAAWLPDFGLEVPVSSDGSVDPGVLSLNRLMTALARKTGITPPGPTEIDAEGYSLDVPVPPKPSSRVKALNLRVVALRRNSSEDPTGFVGSLTESALLTTSLAPRPSMMQQAGHSLQVFSLSKFVTGLVDDMATRTQGRVQLETPRDVAHVVAHRAELQGALEHFLLEASSHAGSKSGPVLAIKERRQRVELRIMDLRLDAPEAALERTLLAPGNPPEGLEALGELVRTIQNSHGDVKLSLEDSWGVVLTASLVRARPRVETAPEAALLRLRDKPVRIG